MRSSNSSLVIFLALMVSAAALPVSDSAAIDDDDGGASDADNNDLPIIEQVATTQAQQLFLEESLTSTTPAVMVDLPVFVASSFQLPPKRKLLKAERMVCSVVDSTLECYNVDIENIRFDPVTECSPDRSKCARAMPF